MLPFETPTIFEQLPRFIFQMPRVVTDQKTKFENDELFRKLSRETEVSLSINFTFILDDNLMILLEILSDSLHCISRQTNWGAANSFHQWMPWRSYRCGKFHSPYSDLNFDLSFFSLYNSRNHFLSVGFFYSFLLFLYCSDKCQSQLFFVALLLNFFLIKMESWNHQERGKKSRSGHKFFLWLLLSVKPFFMTQFRRC